MYSTGMAYLLWLLSGFGALGFHRFYLGKVRTGILWACTGGLAMVGSIYDFFTLPRQVQEANIRKAVLDQMYAKDFYQEHWRAVNDGEAHPVKEKDSVERSILKLAKANKGILTPAEVALGANIPIEEAKKNLEQMVSKGFAEIRVRKSGTLVYTIPEMVENDSSLETF